MIKKINLIDTKDKKNKMTTWQQDVEIALNQFFYPWKDLATFLGALSLPSLNNFLANIKPCQDANNVYTNFLKTLQLDNISILKDLSVNGILTGTSFLLLLIALSKPFEVKRKIQACKDLKITDNKKTTGNTIIPIRDTISFKNPSIRKLVCYSNGILPDDFEENNNKKRLSKKWGNFITDIEEYKNNKLIIYYKRHSSDKMLFFENKFLPKEASLYALGENDRGEIETVDLDKASHMIIASSSGRW